MWCGTRGSATSVNDTESRTGLKILAKKVKKRFGKMQLEVGCSIWQFNSPRVVSFIQHNLP
jgi:hypothetical protein